ncbi:uncharacterized protein LOC109610002 [Camponotus floridanus]|uniref:uncharacterized protein LOC109610002 n=1 Tax=Camponotus floridanus TaxID=104421 RepID=UPI0009716C41|nr:uncharacterized protein LOC109610002 [Camponotus floridanus]
MSLNMEKNNDNPTKKESNRGTDLLDNFALLKTYVSLLENMIQTPKHSQLQSVDKSLSQLYNSEIATFHDKSDVDMDFFHDFYKLTGIRCVKLERKSSFVFEMCSNKTDKKENYMVEILIDDHGRALLGDSKLPAPVNVEEILSKYPIDVSNITRFLNSCKHYVETYVCRKKQFTDLENLLLEIADAEVYHDYEFTLITITIPGIMYINTEQIYKIELDLYYKPDEIRPYKLSSACKEASSRFLKKLNKFFKPFLRENLCSALLQINISNAETNLFWQKIMINDDSVESYEVESSIELLRGIFKPYLYRKNKE